MRRGHCLKTWSAIQKAVGLRSGEVEQVAVVKISCKVMGATCMIKEMGCDVDVVALVDCNAALGIVSRKCNRKL